MPGLVTSRWSVHAQDVASQLVDGSRKVRVVQGGSQMEIRRAYAKYEAQSAAPHLEPGGIKFRR